MNCYYHPMRPAVAQCLDCHKGLYQDCAHKYDIPICDTCNNKRRSDNLAHYIKPIFICCILYFVGWNIDILGPDRMLGAYMLMCAYGGWKFINQFVPFIFIWFNIEAVFWYFLIKLVISMFIGFFTTPIYIVFCFYKIIRLIIIR